MQGMQVPVCITEKNIDHVHVPMDRKCEDEMDLVDDKANVKEKIIILNMKRRQSDIYSRNHHTLMERGAVVTCNLNNIKFD